MTLNEKLAEIDKEKISITRQIKDLQKRLEALNERSKMIRAEPSFKDLEAVGDIYSDLRTLKIKNG